MDYKKNVVLGVCGGIAAYKALDVISNLNKRGINVDVVMTDNAQQFVSELSFQAISQNPVITDMFQEPKAWEIQHISLAKKADLIAVIPATANVIGKIANGIADDMLTTTVMASKAPVIFAPAMNTNMYSNPIVQQNIKKLWDLGYKFIEPACGRLACGDEGQGKLANTDEITELILSNLYSKKDLIGKKVLVTAGPTIVPLDPVRYITNRSSGKMGYAIAEEARDRGAEVILVSGPSALKEPVGMEVVKVSTNEEMYKVLIKNFTSVDILIKSAAVADYKPEFYSDQKIKKTDDMLLLKLIQDRDILKELGSRKNNQILVGFAAESNDVLKNATAKILKKNLDYIVANDISGTETGFASDFNKVSIINKDGDITTLDKMTKREVAKNLFDIINKKR